MTGAGLVLLASFPKSGNTWLRLIMDSVLHGADPDINRIETGSAAQRDLLDAWLDCETSDLSAVQIARMRPWAYRRAAERARAPLVLKTHDALLPFAANAPAPFSADAVRATIYLVRDPRDVAVSWAHHMGCSVDETIGRMADEAWSASASDGRLSPQVDQLYSSWSRHVESWIDAPDFRLTLIRYEDLRADPRHCLAPALAFAGLEVPGDDLDRALEATRFERLQTEERARGFVERKRQATDVFFRSGRAGGWRESLTPAQARRIEADQGPVMRRLGYLSD